jgi:hypothetical protein
MADLIALLNREDGREKPDAEACLHQAAKHNLTVEELIRGQRDAGGHILAKGYVGWFDGRGGATPAQVSRICLEMGCSPSTPLADLLEITV